MKDKYRKFLILIGLICFAFPIEIYADTANFKQYTITTKESNRSSDKMINIGTYTFNKPSSVYDFVDEDGYFNSIYTSQENVYWTKFDQDMTEMSTVSWENYLDKDRVIEAYKDITYTFGNALYYNGYLYVMYSEPANYTTTEERDSQIVMAMVKYDKEGNIVKTGEYLGVDLNPYTSSYSYGTSFPFYASNCSMTVNDDVIAVFFGRNMYNNHQSSMLMFVDPETLNFVSNIRNDVTNTLDNFQRYYFVSQHYVSHSFGQRIIPTSDGQFLLMESGDAGVNGATRGLMLTKTYEYYDEENDINTLKESMKKMVHYSEGGADTWGYNDTYSVLGNIIELSDGYLYVGGLDRVLNLAYGNGIDHPWDLFVQKYTKDFYLKTDSQAMQLLDTPVRVPSGIPAEYNGYGRLYLTGDEKDYGLKWLTSLEGETVILVRAVKIDNDNVVILWEQTELRPNSSSAGYYVTDGDEDIYYMIIDKDANVVKEATKIDGARMNDEEQYVYKNGKIYWTTTSSKTLTTNVLTIYNHIDSIELNESQIQIDKGEKFSLNATISPSDTTDSKELKWTSSNEKVVTVDEFGNLTAVGYGFSTITVETSNGKVAVCNVQVGDFIKGDVNQDWKITITDVIKLLRIYLDLEEVTNDILNIGDMNDDGDITITDVIKLLRVYLNLE